MSRISCAMLAGVFLFLADGAAAQSSVGLPGGPGSGTPRSEASHSQSPFAEEFDTRRLLEDPTAAAALHGRANLVASCVARRAGEKASRFLGGSLSDDPSYRELSKALAGRYRECNRNDQYLPPMLVSGALAEDLLQRDNRTLSDRAQAVDVDRATKFFGGFDGDVTLDTIAGCDAVYSPGLVQKVLAAPSGGADEKSALDALYGNTPECGVPSTPTNIPAIYQRSALAMALYFRNEKFAAKN